MKDKVIINDKEDEIPDFSFNTICDLGEIGVSLESLNTNPMGLLRGVLAVVIGNKQLAGEEIEKHVLAGGNLAPFSEIVAKKIEESGFFQHLIGQTPEKPTKK